MAFRKFSCMRVFKVDGPHFVQYVNYSKRVGLGYRSKMQSKIRDAVKPPAAEKPIAIGQKFLIGGSAVGLGLLASYGIFGTRTGQMSAVDSFISGQWSEHMRKNIQSTYMYFGGGLATTAVSAVVFFRNTKLMGMLTRGGWPVMIGGMLTIMGTGALTMGIPYPQSGIGAKHAMWLLHSGLLGIFVAPLCILGGPILRQAALMTAGIVGGLSTVAVTAPSDKFLNMGGALGMGLGVVLCATLGSVFVGPTGTLGMSLYSIYMYGGLVLFGGFMLYDTQKIIHRAEASERGIQEFDPINNSLTIYADAINIFIRIATLLAGGGHKRK